MPKQICDPEARELSPSLDERIARLRRRQIALTQLIDSFTAYAEFAGQESDLTRARRPYDLSGQLLARCAPASLC